MPDPDKYQEILTVLIAGGVAFLILTGIVVFIILFYQKHRFRHQRQLADIQNNYEHQLLTTRLEMQEQTLQLFGQEVHDNIGQLLSTTKMFMRLAEQAIPEIPPSFKTADDTLSKAIRELRAISKSFNAEWLNQFDVQENLQLETDRINASGTICMVFNHSNATIPLASDAQIMVFRVVQEAIQNSIKHANAKTIEITLAVDDDAVDIEVKDNGIGFTENLELKNGVGRMNMRHRVELLGGTISWVSERGKGTRVSISIPYQTMGV